MAYIKIFSNGNNRQIGEMRIINGKNTIFNMQGKEVGYCIIVDGEERFYDISGRAVATVEELIKGEK